MFHILAEQASKIDENVKEIYNTLKERKVDPWTKDNLGWNAFHYAC